MRRFKKTLKYITLLLLLLIFVVVGSGYYFLNTTSGIRQAVSLVNKYTQYVVTVEEISGELLGRTELKKLHIKGNNLEINSDSVILDWKSSALWNKELIIRAIAIDNTTVMLAPAEKKPHKNAPFILADLDLPIDIQLEDLLITNLTLKNPIKDPETEGKGDVIIDKIQLNVNYIGQKAVIEKLTVAGHDTQVNLTGEATTKGNYPIHLKSSTDYNNQTYGQAKMDVSLDGALKDSVALVIDASGLSDFHLDATMASLFKSPSLDSTLKINHFNGSALGFPDVKVSGDLAVSGVWSAVPNIKTKGEIFYDSAETDKTKLTIDGAFDGNEATLSTLTIDLLTAKQQLTGHGSFSLINQTLDVALNTEAFHWPQNAIEPAFLLTDSVINVSGNFNDYNININGKAKTKAIGETDLTIKANGNLSAIEHFDALVTLNGQLLTLSGKTNWKPTLGYQARIKADKISPFNQLPGFERLNLNVQGDANNYKMNGSVYVYADNIPPSEVALAIDGDLGNIKKADFTLKTLGGIIQVGVKGKLKPLDIEATATADGIQPQRFYSEMQGTINNTLRLTAKKDGDNLSAKAVIERLSGTLQGYEIAGKGTVEFEQAQKKITIDGLSLDIAGNSVNADGVLVLDSASGHSDLEATIDAKYLDRLLPDLSGVIVGQLSAKGALDKPKISAHITGEKIAYRDFQVTKAIVKTKSQYDAKTMIVNTENEIFYDSPLTDKLSIIAHGSFDGDIAELTDFKIDLLTAKQQVSGRGDYRLSSKAMNVAFNSLKLYWPQNVKNPPVTLRDSKVLLTGSLDDYSLQVNTIAETSAVGDVPLAFSTRGDLNSLKELTATSHFNNQPIKLDGSVHWKPKFDYKFRVKANDIKAYQSFPALKKIDIEVDGDKNNYRIVGNADVKAKNIPPANLTFDIAGTPIQLSRANILMKTLGGTVDIEAKGVLSPLAASGTIRSNNIQLQRFYPNIQATINEEIFVTANQSGKYLNATADIRQLSGRLQKKPFSGSGIVRFEQAKNEITMQGVRLDVAGNSVDVNGILSLDMKQGKSSLNAHVEAPKLRKLLPNLRGDINADIVVKGNLIKPNIDATISGKNVSYKKHAVKKINAEAKINLSDGSLALKADLRHVKSGKTVIKGIKATIDGKMKAHKLSLSATSPRAEMIPSISLAGNGGFNQKTMAWKGEINKLDISNTQLGKWQLKNATPLMLSKDNIRITQLCLRQPPTNVCVDGSMKGRKGSFDVKFKELSAKRFKSFLPKTVRLQTTLSGDANLVLKDGKPKITGKISANGGKFTVIAGAGMLASDIQRLDAGFTLKKNRFEVLLKSKFSRLGTFDIAAEIPNVSKGKIRANLKINTPNLQFLESLVPQLGDVDGRLTGDMSIVGVPSKSLQLTGKITLHKTRFNIPQFGSNVRDLTLDIYAKNGNKIGFKGSAKAGKGDFDIFGEVDPATQHGIINLKGKNFELANSRKLQMTISPDIKVVVANGIKVRGKIHIPHALIVPASTGSKVTVSEDVILPNQTKKKALKPSPVDLEIAIKLGDDVRVASADIETRLLGGVKISAQSGRALKATGAIRVENGELRIYGQMLTIERGRVIFGNGPISNPSLDIRTVRTVNDITVGANVLGNVQNPEISLFSTPSMADSSILSYLLFGHPPGGDAFGMTALLQTGGVIGANSLARDLRSSLGLDVLDLSLSGMAAGKDITDQLYVGVRSNFFTALNKIIANYKISSRTHIESAFSKEEISIDLIKIIEMD